jgi:hypothetical protein
MVGSRVRVQAVPETIAPTDGLLLDRQQATLPNRVRKPVHVIAAQHAPIGLGQVTAYFATGPAAGD